MVANQLRFTNPICPVVSFLLVCNLRQTTCEEIAPYAERIASDVQNGLNKHRQSFSVINSLLFLITIMPIPKKYCPDLFGFRTLFGESEFKNNDCLNKIGFPSGSSILITGSAGSGKTVFSLSVVRALMYAHDNSKLYYVSTSKQFVAAEPHENSVLHKRYSDYGWFRDTDKVFDGTRVKLIDVSESALPQPTRGADELINPVFTKLADDWRHSSKKELVFLVIDNITALLKDSVTEGDRRRNLEEIIERCKTLFPKDALALLFLLAERTDSRSSAYEEHVADFVIRLGVQKQEASSRRSTMEITKSQDSNVLLGEYTWATINQDNQREILTFKPLLLSIRNKILKQYSQSSQFQSIIVLAPPRLFKIGNLQKWKHLPNEETSERLSTGTPGLDQMLSGASEHWAQPTRMILNQFFEKTSLAKNLRVGSTTLIIGKSGAGKTLASLQFLLGYENENLVKKSLYINFENRPSRICQVFPADLDQITNLKGINTIYRRRSNLDLNTLLAEIRYAIGESEIERVAIDGLSDLLTTLSPAEWSKLIENLLVSIREESLSGVSRDMEEIQKIKRETGSCDKKPRKFATIFVTLEKDSNRDYMTALEPLSFAADNLIIFDHVSVNDQLHKTVRIIKARGHSPDRQVREIVVCANNSYPLRIISGLENYRGLLAGNPRPVRVTLQLLAENDAEKKFNRKLRKNLKKLFAYPVKTLGFSKNEIHRTLLDVAAGITRIPQANVKILNIDEWWIRELQVSSTQHSAKNAKPINRQHPLLSLEAYIHAPHADDSPSNSKYVEFSSDYLITELEKATSPRLMRTDESDAKQSLHWNFKSEMVACPSYLDYGLFCFNRKSVTKIFGDSCLEWKWDDYISRLPRTWARLTSQLWFDSPGEDASVISTVVDFMKCVLKSTNEFIGFAFDMETPSSAECGFLELCWAFGATEDFLIQGALLLKDAAPSDQEVFIQNNPITLALQLLQFLVLEELMPSRTTNKDTKRAVFSRHWYCSWQDLLSPRLKKTFNSNDERQNDDLCIYPIPFFPMGTFSINPNSTDYVGKEIIHAIQDANVRFLRTLLRIRAAYEYRIDEKKLSLNFQQDLKLWCEEAKVRCEKITQWLSQNEFLRKSAAHAELTWMRKIGESLRTIVQESTVFQVGRGIRRRDNSMCENKTTDEIAEECWLWRRMAAATGMDLRDAEYLLEWHFFRIELIEAELANRPLASIFCANNSASTQQGSALTGYCCSGSWMVGVDRSTHSPNLAAKFIEEICSTRRAVRRAKHGAGIPARKDFYDFHGHKSLFNFKSIKPNEYDISWRNFHKFAAARSRRRERIVCPFMSVSLVLETLTQGMFHCLSVAEQRREAYRHSKEDVVQEMQTLARNAARKVFAQVEAEMRNADKDNPPCVMCFRNRKCRDHQQEVVQ